MHQAFFVKFRLFELERRQLTSQCRPMHFGFESSGGPSLKKAAGHSIADFEFGHRSTDGDDFPGSVRQAVPALGPDYDHIAHGGQRGHDS